MKHLRFSYLVLALCAGLVAYGLWYGTSRTTALFRDTQEASGVVGANAAFPTTPTLMPPTAIPPTSAPVTATPERTRAARTGTPAATATVERTVRPPRTSTVAPATTSTRVATAAAEATAALVATLAPEEAAIATPAREVVAPSTQAPAVSPEGAAQAAEAPAPTPAAPVAAAQPVTERTPSGVVAGEEAAPEGGVCTDQLASLAFGDDASYSGSGPFSVFVLLRNDGGSAASDVVLAFTVIEGGEFFDEAEFGNGQLWWAHGQPDAGIIYYVPNVDAGGSAGARFVAEMTPGWTPDGRTVIRVTVASAACAEPTSDELLLTFTADGEAPTARSTAEPSRTPTPVSTRASTSATAVSTVLGIDEEPTRAPRETATLPSGQTLPDGGDGDEDSGTTALLVLAFVGVALGFLAVGLFAGRLLPR